MGHSLSLSADGDYTPLIYEFGYTQNTSTFYFSSLIGYDSFISNVYLPIGDFDIFVNVIDSKSSRVSDFISCSIGLDSYSQCIAFKQDIIEEYLD